MNDFVSHTYIIITIYTKLNNYDKYVKYEYRESIIYNIWLWVEFVRLFRYEKKKGINRMWMTFRNFFITFGVF